MNKQMGVLVLDDSALQGGFLVHQLRSLSYRAWLAQDRQTALACCEGEDIELALIESLMFEDNGFELAEDLRAKGIKKIILLSGMVLEAHRVWASKLKLQGILHRPVQPDSLLAVLEVRRNA